jgi:hypothetical protein
MLMTAGFCPHPLFDCVFDPTMSTIGVHQRALLVAHSRSHPQNSWDCCMKIPFMCCLAASADNMSIVGVTIDYGPFGFLDHTNLDHVCNGSDDSGRYSYRWERLPGQVPPDA